MTLVLVFSTDRGRQSLRQHALAGQADKGLLDQVANAVFHGRLGPQKCAKTRHYRGVMGAASSRVVRAAGKSWFRRHDQNRSIGSTSSSSARRVRRVAAQQRHPGIHQTMQGCAGVALQQQLRPVAPGATLHRRRHRTEQLDAAELQLPKRRSASVQASSRKASAWPGFCASARSNARWPAGRQAGRAPFGQRLLGEGEIAPVGQLHQQ